MVNHVLSRPSLLFSSNSVNVLGNYIVQIGLVIEHQHEAVASDTNITCIPYCGLLQPLSVKQPLVHKRIP